MPAPDSVPEPWASFLSDLDAELIGETSLYCVGGFAITVQYGLPRQTSDIDVLSIAPFDQTALVRGVAGAGKKLHTRHGLYIQEMGGIVTLPENYQDRAVQLFQGCYPRLRLFGLDAYDLAVSKLERNYQRDRDDVKYLFKSKSLDPKVLADRYRTEQRPYLSNEKTHDLTLSLWLKMLEEE
jgi:hypothetical protein